MAPLGSLLTTSAATGGGTLQAGWIRILVIDQARGVWGAQRYLLRLAPLLQEHGIDMTLACPRSLELHGAWLAAGFDALHIELPTERHIRGPRGFTLSALATEMKVGSAMASKIRTVARNGGYDLLWSNAHWTHLETAIAGRVCGVPTLLHLHEESIPGVGAWLRAVAVRMATSTVAVSGAVANGVPTFARERVHVVPNGVDIEALTPPTPTEDGSVRAELGVRENEVMLLAATRIDPTKRIEDLFECVRSIDDVPVRLVVAGSTSAYPEYERKIRERARGDDRIVLCGHRDDVPRLLGASDVVVHAGIAEGMPLTVVEAQACGKPVVAYDVAGVSEALEDGTSGFLVAAGDVRGLSVAVRRLALDTHLRATMGQAARNYAVSNHQIQQQADRIAAVVESSCRGGRRVR